MTSTCPTTCTDSCVSYDSSIIPTTCQNANDPIACFKDTAASMSSSVPTCPYQCLNGTCKACAADTDCPGGGKCTDGKCVAFPCSADTDCGAGMCFNGTCVAKTCSKGTPCPEGFTCKDGVCSEITKLGAWPFLILVVLLVITAIVIIFVALKVNGAHPKSSGVSKAPNKAPNSGQLR
jgi:hypothetical protein